MKYLMDNVHGSITLCDDEVGIIDHMLFQRLRYIKQNDILYLTFMGATHTRFSHSLGVMHMGSKIFDILFPLEMHAEDSSALISIFYLKKILRMALLFHDTGHSAFSHLVEHMSIFQQEVYSQPIEELLWPDVDDSRIKNVATSVQGSTVAHEHYSVRVAYEIMRDNKFPENEIWDVLSLMEGFPSESMSDNFISASETVFDNLSRNNEMPNNVGDNMRYILHFILSSEVDADKLDYLRRDSLHAGVGYGGYDAEGLINALRLVFDYNQKRFVVTISETSVSSLCDIVDARYKLYCHISNNIGNNGAELIFESAVEEVMANKNNAAKIISRMQDMKGFRFFTDDMIMYMISDHALENEDSYCHAFISRKRANHIATFKTHQDKDIDQSINTILDKYGSDKVRVSTKKVKFSHVDDCYSDLMVRRKMENGKWRLCSLTEATDFFETRKSFTQYGCYLA